MLLIIYRGPLLGFWTTYHRDGGFDSIEDKLCLKKANFVEADFSFAKLGPCTTVMLIALKSRRQT